MGINLFAASARGMFIGMLCIMIVVTLLFGFILYMVFKQTKKPADNADASNVKKLLTRRETRLTIEIMECKGDEAKKTELLNKLRRVKSAQNLVDELLAEENAISAETDAEVDKQEKEKKAHAGGQHKPARKPGEQPAMRRPANQPAGQSAENRQQKLVEPPAAKASAKPAEQPVAKAPAKLVEPPAAKAPAKPAEPTAEKAAPQKEVKSSEN